MIPLHFLYVYLHFYWYTLRSHSYSFLVTQCRRIFVNANGVAGLWSLGRTCRRVVVAVPQATFIYSTGLHVCVHDADCWMSTLDRYTGYSWSCYLLASANSPIFLDSPSLPLGSGTDCSFCLGQRPVVHAFHTLCFIAFICSFRLFFPILHQSSLLFTVKWPCHFLVMSAVVLIVVVYDDSRSLCASTPVSDFTVKYCTGIMANWRCYKLFLINVCRSLGGPCL